MTLLGGTYVGLESDLAGQHALIQSTGGSHYLVQFDQPYLVHPKSAAVLSHGWHLFPAADFRLDAEQPT